MTLTGPEFEDEVRRVARELWPASRFDGAAIEDGRERDGIFETEWVIHLIEATTWRTKEKAEKDIEKLVKLRRRLISSGKPVQCWFVTLNEPTADQRAVAPRDNTVRVLSFEQFRGQLVDAHGYLRIREKCAFGSARDPESGDVVVRDAYLPTSMVSSSGERLGVTEVAALLQNHRRLVILGDYGAGKSMTMRELFLKLAGSFRKSETSHFPLHLNLRDHYAQVDPSEAIVRHATSIGFSDPSQLVRAWRAGYSTVLLDGFDEMATPGWAGSSSHMRDLRRRSVELVRRFIRETPVGAGVALAGRQHYFDSPGELAAALGIGPTFLNCSLSEFDENQIEQYLKSHGWDQGLPNWLPARPLLLSYLAHRELLREAFVVPAGSSPAMAWHNLLSLICDREAEIEANVDGTLLRSVVERLASVARTRGDGLGPIDFRDIEQAFRSSSGYVPDDRAMVLLQRLPGLGPLDAETGSRRFIDADLADTARAGDVVRFAQNPYDTSLDELDSWNVALGDIGVDVAAFRLSEQSIPVAGVVAAARLASDRGTRPYLTLDLARTALALGAAFASQSPIAVDGVWLAHLEFDDPDTEAGGVTFRDCVIEQTDLPRDGVDEPNLPLFVRCHFGSVLGRTSARDLPASRFDACTFDSFSESATTTSQVMASSLPIGQRVGLSILRKLYLQRGSGRKEEALYRGLSRSDQRVVEAALQILERFGLAIKTHSGRQRIWVPARRSTARVYAMLEGPTTCKDEAWQELKDVL